MKFWLALLLVLGLGGCATYPNLNQAHGPCTGEPGGWCDFTRNIAQETWLYAQLSSNAYCDDDVPFALPARVRLAGRMPRQEVCETQRAKARGLLAKGKKVRHAKLTRTKRAKGEAVDLCQVLADAQARAPTMDREDPALEGFSYALYDVTDPNGGEPTRVIAFRGTDFFQLSDWIHGNLGKDHTEFARCLYAQQRRELGPTRRIVLTGHSLGGALALQVSVDRSEARKDLARPNAVYVFDNSPRYSFDGDPIPVRRIAVVERGEILSGLRARYPVARQDLLEVNCRPYANAASNHAIRPLAECLTWIAAKGANGNEGTSPPGSAAASVKANCIKTPDGELANDVWGLADSKEQREAMKRAASSRKFEGCESGAGA